MSRSVPKPFPAFKGEEPFVFISYAHADKEEVYPDIVRLHEKRCRIWYDEGIDPGRQFPEEIAKRIKACLYFIVFLSPNAIRSTYVRKEIEYAHKQQKQLLPVYLKETELPDDLDFIIGPLRLAVFKYELAGDEYIAQLEKPIPRSCYSGKYPPGTPEHDLACEIELRMSDPAAALRDFFTDLLEFGLLLGLSEEGAREVLREMGVSPELSKDFETFSKLIDSILKRGEIVPERRQTLANSAKRLGLPAAQWEMLVQQRAVARAKELERDGKFELAKRVLISCVGEVVPQSPEVRELLEGLARSTAPAPAGTSPPAPATLAEPGTAVPDQVRANRAITSLAEDLSITWVRIPAGLFQRGCPDHFIRYVEGKYGVEADVLRTYPERKEPLDEFWIMRTSVTNAQYYAFVKATGHRYPAGWRGVTPPYDPADAEKPVTGVTWQDSADFAAWLGARPPSRAEYEKAARGEEGLLFPWGNEFDPAKCNTAESGRDELTPADAFPEGASPYGVLDLVGNVWEWVDGKRGELTMTVGASYEATGEIYGVTFFDVSRPAESSERDLGFRVACSHIGQLLLGTEEVRDGQRAD